MWLVLLWLCSGIAFGAGVYPAQPVNLSVAFGDEIMADRYWVASSTQAFDSTTGCSGTTCWATTSGGSPGAAVPTTSDDVYFDANGSGDCSGHAVDMNGANWDLTGYTGTITIPNWRRLIVFGGSFTAGSTATITHAGLNSIGLTIYQSDASQSINLGTGVLDSSVDGLESQFGYASSEIKVQGEALGAVFSMFTPVNTRWIEQNGDLKVAEIDFTPASGTVGYKPSGHDLYVTEDIAVNSNVSWTASTGVIILGGTSSPDIDFDGESVEAIEIDKSAGTVTLSGAVTTQSLAVDRGTLDIDAQAVDVSGNMTSDPVAGAVTVQDTTGGGSISITGTIAMAGTATYGVTWDGVDIDALGTGTNTFSYATISNSNNSSGVSIDCTNNCTDGGSNTGLWNFGTTSSIPVFMHHYTKNIGN